MSDTLPISKAFWRGGKRRGNRVRLVHGITNSYAGPVAEIDASIANLILLLNLTGAETTYCCSGLTSDHRLNGAPAVDADGYVSFKRAVPEWLYLEGVRVEEDCIRVDGSNRARKRAWVAVEQAIRGYMAK